MDYDADGRIDVISGSYTGEVYLFRRQVDGSFAQGTRIQGRDGKDLKISYSVTPEAVDVDADGDLDLVVGTRMDPVQIFVNEGTRAKPSWNPEARPLRDEHGTPIKGSNAHHADWDGDGVRDLVLGKESGGVRWCKNIGKNDRPVYQKARHLILRSPYSIAPNGSVPTEPRTRTKVHVCDWNGDGLADLLVGDAQTQIEKGPPLTPKEAEDKAALDPGWRELRNRMGDLLNEKWKSEREKKPMTESLKVRLASLRKEYAPYAEKMKKFQKDEYHCHGWVWLYLRKAEPVGGK